MFLCCFYLFSFSFVLFCFLWDWQCFLCAVCVFHAEHRTIDHWQTSVVEHTLPITTATTTSNSNSSKQKIDAFEHNDIVRSLVQFEIEILDQKWMRSDETKPKRRRRDDVGADETRRLRVEIEEERRLRTVKWWRTMATIGACSEHMYQVSPVSFAQSNGIEVVTCVLHVRSFDPLLSHFSVSSNVRHYCAHSIHLSASLYLIIRLYRLQIDTSSASAHRFILIFHFSPYCFRFFINNTHYDSEKTKLDGALVE